MSETFRTLRGFLAGGESEAENYFFYSATLRIFGDISDLDEVSSHLGLRPTSVHRKGDKRGPRGSGFSHDLWSYTVPVDKRQPLSEHIDALWTQLKPHRDYLVELKSCLRVDVFLGYQSNCDSAGVEVPFTSLEMFVELKIPLGVSIIVT